MDFRRKVDGFRVCKKCRKSLPWGKFNRYNTHKLKVICKECDTGQTKASSKNEKKKELCMWDDDLIFM